MCFKQVLKCRLCKCSSDVQRQTVPRSRTSDGECPVVELATSAWNEEVTNVAEELQSSASDDVSNTGVHPVRFLSSQLVT